MNSEQTILTNEAIGLLKKLIAIPSFSQQEDKTADLIENFLLERKIKPSRKGNNLLALNLFYDEKKPTILLNSHHDTVKPNFQYTRDPFSADEEDGKLFGLGSNDAGGCLVSLIAVFLYFSGKKDLNYNIILATTAEEEISGPGGIEYLLSEFPKIDAAIVGEPTQMQLAVAERGLMVLDCIAHGKAGHAARKEGENAILKAIQDIQWISEYMFPKISPLLGANQMTVTVLETENKAHNVVPAQCSFVVDARINELYSFEEVLEVIQSNIQSEVKPRSTRLRSTSIPEDHPLVVAGMKLGLHCYGSPTTSDKALMPFPALKMGPGDSARSHTADEFIFLEEIEKGIDLYIRLLNQLV